MKLFVVGVAAASSWKQPTYWDAFERAKERMSSWGHPVNERAAASYHLCPTITLPAGVQERNQFNQSKKLGSNSFPNSNRDMTLFNDSIKELRMWWRHLYVYLWTRKDINWAQTNQMQIQKVTWIFLGKRISRMQRTGIHGLQTLSRPSRPNDNFENADLSTFGTCTAKIVETHRPDADREVLEIGGLWIPGKGCDPEIEVFTNNPDPNSYPFNGVGFDFLRSDYIRTFCENDARNRQSCSFACPNGVKMMFNGHTIPARKIKLKCRCPRVNGIKTCGWSYKRNLLTAGLDAYISWFEAHVGTILKDSLGQFRSDQSWVHLNMIFSRMPRCSDVSVYG